MKLRIDELLVNSKRGFTLIELVIVIGVMSTLAMIMVPNITSYLRKAEEAVARENLMQAYQATMIVREIGNLKNPQKYAYTDVEDDSEFMALMKEYLNIKYFDRSTGKGEKIIFLNWSKEHTSKEIRIWYEMKDGRRLKLKNGKIDEKVYKPTDHRNFYGRTEWGYRTHGGSIY